MDIPNPTPIYRITHIDNLHIFLERGGLHAPNFEPNNGLEYRQIHNTEIQQSRQIRTVPCGPEGTLYDYIPFYFGPRSPMLLQLHTGQVEGYTEGQSSIIYLVSTVQNIVDNDSQFVFTDGHGIAAFTNWFDNIVDLDKVDWSIVNAEYWIDTPEDPDRQRKKQAEFLIYQFCDWSLINEIGVLDDARRRQVQEIFDRSSSDLHRDINIRPEWYY